MKKKFSAVELKYLSDADVEQIRVWRNQDFVKKNMFTQHEITEEEHRKYMNSIRKDENKSLFLFYLNQKPFGVFHYQYYPEGDYVMGGNYLISRDYEGYGVLQVYFINEILFRHLKFRKNYYEILESNKKLLSMNKKIGGTQERILRNHAKIGKTYQNVYCFSLLADEWDKKKKKIEDLVFQFVERDYLIKL